MTDQDRITNAILLDFLDGVAKECRTVVALIRQNTELKRQLAELKSSQGETIEVEEKDVPK